MGYALVGPVGTVYREVAGKPPVITLSYYRPTNKDGRPFMPVEFAVAAYRFAHSIIRPFYVINQTSLDRGGVPIFGPDGGFNLNGGRPIPSDLVMEWKNILGRTIYSKIVSYIRYQMSQLLALVLLFVTATVFDINDGVAMTPLMVLFLNFFIAIFPVIVIMVDRGDPDVMKRPPRNPKGPITNPAAITRWVLYGAGFFLAALVPLVFAPDTLSTD